MAVTRADPARAPGAEPDPARVAGQTRRLWAKIRGETTAGIPVATYNLHPFGPHAQDASYAPLLQTVAGSASMLVKHSLKATVAGARQVVSQAETAPTGTRRTLTWHTPRGPLQAISITPAGQPGYVVEHFIKNAADIERVLSVPHASMTYDLGPTRQQISALGDAGVLYVGYPDPMYSIATLFDFQDFVVRCVTDPDRLQALVDYAMEGAVAEVEALAAACRGLPLLFYTAGPEVATPPMLPPAVFRRFVTPYQRRLIEILHRHGHRAAIHCHGRVRQVLGEILDTGADVLEPIEPPDQGDIGLAELLGQTRARLCLMGHIQDQEFYRNEPGLLRRRVREIAALLHPEDRYIMTPTCTPFQFPATAAYLHAYREWLEAAEEFLP